MDVDFTRAVHTAVALPETELSRCPDEQVRCPAGKRKCHASRWTDILLFYRSLL